MEYVEYRMGGLLNWHERHMLLVEMLDRVTAREGGTTESRQEAYAFFLQEIRGVPTEYKFYRYDLWPTAVDLMSDIGWLRCRSMVRSVPIGPGWETTVVTKWLRDRYSYIVDKYDEDLEVVAERFAPVDNFRLKLLASAFLLSLDGKHPDEQVVTWLSYGYLNFPPELGWEVLQEVREFAESVGWERPTSPAAALSA